jgi:hypothetical protein
MESVIEFNPSAFKHGVTEADIRWALRTRLYDGPVDDDPQKCAVIGFDLVGLPLEVMYNPVDENTIYVFHAMRCRNSIIAQLGL